MNASVCILQISDLHRDPQNPILNSVLISSLRNDRRRYTRADNPAIRTPDVIVVSGDVIQGVLPGTADYARRLDEQHIEALEFLSQLADDVVGGSRERIIIVPGNHDVSACHFMESVTKVNIAPDREKEIVGQLFRTESHLRWSWNELSLYEVSDRERYAQRLQPFAAFYHEFYQGRRTYDLDPAKQFDVFDYPEFDLTVAALSSCYNNDIFNRQGTIHPGALGEVNKHLSQRQFSGRLRVAVWHHNTEGLPMHTDYMDAGTLQNLIDCGFSLGLHGHQHRPDYVDTRFRYGGESRITVISAGTLCGGATFGHGRSYNLIELDCATGQGRLHVREMQNSDLQQPIWGCRPLPPNTTAHLDFPFDAPPQPLVRGHPPTSDLVAAQRLYEERKYRLAALVLSSLAGTEPLARRLLLDCYLRLKDNEALVDEFDPPAGTEEAIHVMDALWHTKRHDRLRTLLDEPVIADSTDPSVIEMRRKYKARFAK